MKRILMVFLTAALVFLMILPASALELDEKATINGMGGKSWYQGYTPEIKGTTMTVCLPIRGEGLTGKLTASLTLDDPDVYLLRDTPREVTVSQSGGIYPVKLTLSLEKDWVKGDYPATVRITCQDAQGKAVEEALPIVLRIRDGRTNREVLTPAITVESTSLDVGSEGSVTFSLHNPSKTLSMTALTLTATDSTGEVVMTGSNRLSLPELLPGQTQPVTVPLSVKGTAAVSLHTLEVKLSYQVLEESKEYVESFSLPVTQAIRLEQGGASLAPTAIAGQLTTVTVPLMNMGKGDLNNVTLTLDMEGIASRQTVLVGTITPGETKEGRLTFTPPEGALGSHEGTVTVSCEDAYGNQAEQILPVTLTVEPPVETNLLTEEEAAPPPAWVIPALSVISFLLLAALITQGILLRGKLHRLEEERL